MAFNLNSLLDSAGGLLGLGGDPFLTPIGQKVLDATHEDTKSVDWNLNLAIVDLVNNTDEGPRDAMRAVRRRIQNTVGKEEHCVYYCLVLLETLAKNCGKRMHLLICSKDFSNELIHKVIPQSTNAQLVQDKILSLIQSWAHAFSVDPDLQGVAEIYMELKKKGVEFPAPSDDDILLVQKSQSDMPGNMSSSSSSSLVSPTKSAGSRPHSRAKSAEHSKRLQAARRVLSGQISQRQIVKINEDLLRAEESIEVLNELLQEVGPQQDPEDVALMLEVANNCKEMQARILQLVQVLEHRETVQRLLVVNDNFNNIFIRFDRYERNKTPATQPTPTKPEQSAELRVPVANTASSRPNSEDAANLVSRPDDFQEMEEWMKQEDLSQLEEMRAEFEGSGLLSGAAGTISIQEEEVEGEVSEEFDKFLKKRADSVKELKP